VDRLRIGLLALIPAAVPLIGAVLCFGPPHLSQWVTAGLCLGFALPFYALGVYFALQSSPERNRRSLRGSIIGGIIGAVVYPILFFQFTVTLPDHCHREVISWSLTPKMAEYIADHPGITLRQAIIEHDDDMDAMFTPSSLSFMQSAFLGMWLALCMSVTLAFAAIAGTPVPKGRIVGGVAEGGSNELEMRVRKMENALEVYSQELVFARHYLQTQPPDAASSLTKSRIVLEKLLIRLYVLEMSKEPRKPLLGDILADNQFTRKIERRILARMHSIRDMGNLGPHGASVEPSDAARVLEDLCEVLEWYLQNYANLPPPNPEV